jgi:hypothetical protein
MVTFYFRRFRKSTYFLERDMRRLAQKTSDVVAADKQLLKDLFFSESQPQENIPTKWTEENQKARNMIIQPSPHRCPDE